MSAVPKALQGTKCAKCSGFILERVDGIPFCSECEKKITGEIKERLPKVRGKVLVSARVG
jgi:ribosomal protein L37AE/L43A